MLYIEVNSGWIEWWELDDTFATYKRFGYDDKGDVGRGVYRWHVESNSVMLF